VIRRRVGRRVPRDREDDPDCVIADIQMPQISGDQLQAELIDSAWRRRSKPIARR
jgi:FixJ family two-component response regulator